MQESSKLIRVFPEWMRVYNLEVSQLNIFQLRSAIKYLSNFGTSTLDRISTTPSSAITNRVLSFQRYGLEMSKARLCVPTELAPSEFQLARFCLNCRRMVVVVVEMDSTCEKEGYHTSKFLCSDLCLSNDATTIIPPDIITDLSDWAFSLQRCCTNNASVKVL